MAYSKFYYKRVHWKNKSESLETPLGKMNLNNMDEGIYQLAENLDILHSELSTGKFDEANAGKVIVGMPAWDPETGILKFKFYDGTEFSVDFNVEKIPVSFSMDSAGVITMTTSDGTEWTADIGDVIPTYSYEDSDTIAFSDAKDGEHGHVITASVKKSSITDEHMQPNYLADITTQASSASASAASAAQSATDAWYDAKLAQSYSVGGSGVREGEDTDNAKFHAEQAALSSQSAGQSAQKAEDEAGKAAEQAEASGRSAAAAKDSEDAAKASRESTEQSAADAQVSAENASQSAAEALQSAQNAGVSESNASGFATEAESYAHGGTGTRDGEDTDSSKYYSEQSKASSELSRQYRDQSEQFTQEGGAILEEINKKIRMTQFDVDDDGNLIYNGDSAYKFTVDDDGNLLWEVA